MGDRQKLGVRDGDGFSVSYINKGELFTESQARCVATIVREVVNMKGEWIGVTHGVSRTRGKEDSITISVIKVKED